MAKPRKFKMKRGSSKFVDNLNVMVDAINKGFNVVPPLALTEIDGVPTIYLEQPPQPDRTFILKAHRIGIGGYTPIKAQPAYEDDQTDGHFWEIGFEEERDVYFRYTPGGYLEGDGVLCRWIGGRYQVVSPGRHSVTGVLTETLHMLGAADMTVSIDGESKTIAVLGLFFDENSGEVIEATWEENLYNWVATAKICSKTLTNSEPPPPEGCEFGYARYMFIGGSWAMVGNHCTGGGVAPAYPISPPGDPEPMDVYDECCTSGARRPRFGIHTRKGVILSVVTAKGRRIGRHLEGKPFPTMKRPEDLKKFSESLQRESNQQNRSGGRSASSRRPARKVKRPISKRRSKA